MTANKKSLMIIVGFALLATITLGFVLFGGSEKPKPPVAPAVAPPSTPHTTPKTQPSAAVLDNRKRTAAAATLTMLETYATENNGAYPTTAEALRSAVDTYGKAIASSTTIAYRQSYDPADAPKATDIFYYPSYTCTGSEPTPASSRSVAVRYVLSDSFFACAGN